MVVALGKSRDEEVCRRGDGGEDAVGEEVGLVSLLWWRGEGGAEKKRWCREMGLREMKMRKEKMMRWGLQGCCGSEKEVSSRW